MERYDGASSSASVRVRSLAGREEFALVIATLGWAFEGSVVKRNGLCLTLSGPAARSSTADNLTGPALPIELAVLGPLVPSDNSLLERYDVLFRFRRDLTEILSDLTVEGTVLGLDLSALQRLTICSLTGWMKTG